MTIEYASPIEVAQALVAAENAHAVDAVMKLFAEDPAVRSSMDAFSTTAEVRRWQEELAENCVHIVSFAFESEGNTARWDGTIAIDPFRELGLEQLEGSWEIAVETGKITHFTFSLSQDALAQLQTATQGESNGNAEAKKIGILIESDFYEKEIFYYEHRFAEENVEVHWLTRLWGQSSLTFYGHEYKVPFECHESFEDIDDEELRTYDAIIVPSAFVSDRLRFTEDPARELSPATQFLKRAFAEPEILKGIICHGMWLVSAAPELVRDRPIICHPNLYGDVVNMGAIYTDQDVVVDGDLVTGRTGGHCHLFAKKIIEILSERT